MSSSTGVHVSTPEASTANYGLDAWKKQMITKDDPSHVHKSLGIACLLSYIFRVAQMGPSDMGFAKFPSLTLPTIVLHLMLNLSSFEFHIPSKRINSGYRIWPEYRLHSLVFLARTLAVMSVFWYEERYNRTQDPLYDMNLVIVVLGMVAADLSTWSQSKYRSKSIRDLEVSPWVKFAFSAAQFFGTANILFGLRRYSMHMISVMIIQGNAFLMTVRRKNLASQNVLVFTYGMGLLVALVVSTYEYMRVGAHTFLVTATIGHVAIFWRMAPFPSFLRPLQSKYLIWMVLGLALRSARPYLDEVTLEQLLSWYVPTLALMVWTGYVKAMPKSEKPLQKSL